MDTMTDKQKERYEKKLACTPIGDFNDKAYKILLDAKQATEKLLVSDIDTPLMVIIISCINFSYDKDHCYMWYGKKIRGVPIIKFNEKTYLAQPIINFIFNDKKDVNCKCSNKVGCCNPLHLV